METHLLVLVNQRVASECSSMLRVLDNVAPDKVIELVDEFKVLRFEVNHLQTTTVPYSRCAASSRLSVSRSSRSCWPNARSCVPAFTQRRADLVVPASNYKYQKNRQSLM